MRIDGFLVPEVCCLRMRSKFNWTLVLTLALTLFGLSAVQRVYSNQEGGVAGDTHASHGNARSSGKKSHATDSEADEESTSAASVKLIREVEALEHQCLEEVNRVRRAQRLAPLTFYRDLLPVARAYSRRMAEEHFFSHNDPDGRTVRERVSDADIRWRIVGENLAYSNGYVNPVAASVHSWMESPGHRRNLLDPDYNVTAIGAWIGTDGTVYFTQIFLRQ
jgi:uncharacterized protein YkwD